jgi:hypothetical protein
MVPIALLPARTLAGFFFGIGGLYGSNFLTILFFDGGDNGLGKQRERLLHFFLGGGGEFEFNVWADGDRIALDGGRISLDGGRTALKDDNSTEHCSSISRAHCVLRIGCCTSRPGSVM